LIICNYTNVDDYDDAHRKINDDDVLCGHDVGDEGTDDDEGDECDSDIIDLRIAVGERNIQE
jgi:hypothetical protein